MSSLTNETKLEHFERLETFTFYSIVVLDGFNSIFMLALITLTVIKHKIYGLTLWLLIGLEISVVFWVAANIKTYKTAIQLKQAVGTSGFEMAKVNFIRG